MNVTPFMAVAESVGNRFCRVSPYTEKPRSGSPAQASSTWATGAGAVSDHSLGATPTSSDTWPVSASGSTSRVARHGSTKSTDTSRMAVADSCEDERAVATSV